MNNDIPNIQASPWQLRCLAAQRELYGEAKLVLTLRAALVIAGSLYAIATPELSSYAVGGFILLSLLDRFIFARWQEALAVEAATIEEMFDCEVLRMLWNEVKVGRKVDPEVITRHAARYERRYRDPSYEKLVPWYPTSVRVVPLHIARLMCQRANCRWDSEQRRRYANYILGILFAGGVVVLLVSIARKLTVEQLILHVVAPLLPALMLGGEQYLAHKGAAERIGRLKTQADHLWEEALRGAASSELESKSRMLQDEIFEHRKGSPPVFDAIYRRFRSGLQEEMEQAVEAMIADWKQSQTKESENAELGRSS
ncbi:S-4TM family putative pore-forming effector [Carboxydochorda subterranea]|uniref:S-4TM family putative pore-forming effector n=1 Tax=Carboxydichorda subterranea TaxID=3109565 RepID=A0ABZ1C410_9FIRM|nr:S-4TM family putative pore-forming effector [Limnochorda sp. L945t]WRP18817.1 S-4TM family putative pore-forming effector [Limnochorda sp. L945t]